MWHRDIWRLGKTMLFKFIYLERHWYITKQIHIFFSYPQGRNEHFSFNVLPHKGIYLSSKKNRCITVDGITLENCRPNRQLNSHFPVEFFQHCTVSVASTTKCSQMNHICTWYSCSVTSTAEKTLCFLSTLFMNLLLAKLESCCVFWHGKRIKYSRDKLSLF